MPLTRIQTDNYALRVLTDEEECCFEPNTNSTNNLHLKHAQNLLSRFTIILDQECLKEGLMAMANILQLEIGQSILDRDIVQELTPSDKIAHSEVYNYLLRKNELDIALYQWMRWWIVPK